MSQSESRSPEIDAWGRVVVAPDEVFEILHRGHHPASLTVHANAEIDRYNAMCFRFDKLTEQIGIAGHLDIDPQAALKERVDRWILPDGAEVQSEAAIRELLLSRCATDTARERVNIEMRMFSERGLIPLLSLMIALVDHFRAHDIVWGVGRGSSVASYCLFLIGVHHIDSLAFELDINDFLK